MTQFPRCQIFTDGACSPNPGPGGWGAIIRYDGSDSDLEINGGEPESTNNRMEMMAVIRALEALEHSHVITLFSDSRYVIDGATKWVRGWQQGGWRTRTRDPVKNADLWQAMLAAMKRHKVEFRWVRGHSGHVENERADELARRGIEIGLSSSAQLVAMKSAPRTLRHMLLSYKAHAETVIRLDAAGDSEAAAPHEIAAVDLEERIMAHEIEPDLTVRQLLEILA